MAGRGTKPRRGRAKAPPVIDVEAQEVAGAPARPGEEDEPVGRPAEPAEEFVPAAPPSGQEEQAPTGAGAAGSMAEGSPETSEAEPREPEPPPARPSGSRYRLAAGLALVALLAAIVGAWIYGSFGDVRWGSAAGERFDAIARRLDGLAADIEAQTAKLTAAESAIASLRTETAGVATALTALRETAEAGRAADGEDGAIARQISELQSAIDSLAQRVAKSDQGPQVAQLTERLARIEQAVSGLRTDVAAEAEQTQAAGAIGRAYAALADKIAQGAPYAAELEALTALVPTAPGLDGLRARAAEGLPTRAALEKRLGEIAGQLPQAAATAPEGAAADGWWPEVRQRLQGLVSIRRLDQPDWPDVVARAEEAMKEGNFGAAITAVEEAPGSAPPELQAWLRDAKAHRDAQAAIDKLSTSVLRQIAGQG